MGTGGTADGTFLSFLGRPTRPLFLPLLIKSMVGTGAGAGAGGGVGGTSIFSFAGLSSSDSPSEYESAEFPDITGGERRYIRAVRQ